MKYYYELTSDDRDKKKQANADTVASIEASEKGEGVKKFESIDHLFEDLGIE